MNNIPIFLSADNNYAPFIATTIVSMCENTQSMLNFYILDDKISDKNKSKIKTLLTQYSNISIEFIEVDVEKYFKSFKNTMHFSKSMYTRFLIPQLKPDLNKILYSDVDIIALGDIREMYEENLEEYALGATICEEIEGNKLKKANQVRLNLSYNHKYFSSGNLIIDCEKWRNDKIFEKLLDVQNRYKDVLVYPDQDILNKVFDDNYKQLPQKYCYTSQNYEYFDSHKILIRHFNGLLKPWLLKEGLKTELLKDIDKFWYYAKKTQFYEEILNKTTIKTKMQLRILQLMKEKK